MARHSTRPPTEHAILVVDDQPDALASVERLLTREGHRVLLAESGVEALAILARHEVHCVVVDYLMPRMSGADLVREIRRTDAFVQIILQTGYAGDQPPRAMLAALDIQGYHDKTDDPERLLMWVDVGLKTYRLVRGLREQKELQNELVANCSHEFRTPLNVVLGYTELLMGGVFGPVSDEALRALRSIDAASRSLADMVADFLQQAKVDAGVAEPTRDCIDVRALAGEMRRLGTLLLEDKPVVFALELDAAPARIVTDGSKLRAILRNLVTNAAKFTSEGTVALRVLLRGGAVRIEVRDTGPGIRLEDQECIFDAFRQLDGSSTRHHGGVGLGLALSRKLARLLGGDLQVASAPGEGAVFAFVLPLERAGLDARAPATLAVPTAADVLPESSRAPAAR
jgi:signal transduction histidine kinase